MPPSWNTSNQVAKYLVDEIVETKTPYAEMSDIAKRWWREKAILTIAFIEGLQ